MLIRKALITDISRIQLIRNAVTENRLSNPNLVTDDDCKNFMFVIGKGWVCEIENEVNGFAIIDLAAKNIWALFVHPDHERKGVGRGLHDHMLNWYFQRFSDTLWLGTSPHTRAEVFYRKAGWMETGIHGKGEIKFEMAKNNWYASDH